MKAVVDVGSSQFAAAITLSLLGFAASLCALDLAVFLGTALTLLLAGALAGRCDSAPGWLRAGSSSDIPELLLDFVGLEVMHAVVITASLGPRLVKRSPSPVVFVADVYDLITVTGVIDGQVTGRLDDGREVRTALPGADAEPGSRWLVRVREPDEPHVPVARLR